METKDFHIITCSQCGTKNRIPRDKIDMSPKCGKCHVVIKDKTRGTSDSIKLRCTECWAINKVPLNRIQEEAKCGKCGVMLATKELLTKSSLEITDVNFEMKVLHSPLPVLLFAWAPWCPTCQSFLPVVESFAGDSEGKARVGKINVDTSPSISSEYAIMSVPRIFIFDRGQLKEELPGSLQKHELMSKMLAYLL